MPRLTVREALGAAIRGVAEVHTDVDATTWFCDPGPIHLAVRAGVLVYRVTLTLTEPSRLFHRGQELRLMAEVDAETGALLGLFHPGDLDATLGPEDSLGPAAPQGPPVPPAPASGA